MSCNTKCSEKVTTCIRGPCGPCGPVGPTGPTGPQGPQGPAGSNASPDLEYITENKDFDFTTKTSSFNIILDSSTAIGNGGDKTIKLPQPTADNAGMIVEILISTAVDNTNGLRIGFADNGSAVMKGGVDLIQHSNDTENIVHVTTNNTQSIYLRSATAEYGGEAGTSVKIIYATLNVANVSGKITTSVASTTNTDVKTNTLSTTGYV